MIRTGINKIINGSRYFLVHLLSGAVPFYLVTEYPKSGGTWLGQLISGYFSIPFPRNVFPKIGMSVVHGHYLPSLKTGRTRQIFWLVRDGRDVVVSSYFYYFVRSDKDGKNSRNYKYFTRHLGFGDVKNIKENLPKYIKFLFTHKPSRLFRYGHEGNWASFNRSWDIYSDEVGGGDNLIRTSYEALRKNTVNELTRIISLMEGEVPNRRRIIEVVEQFDFKKQTGRKPGEEDQSSFLRKGVVGDWKNYFTRESAGIFDNYAGDVLVKLGYEPNNEWVQRVE